MIEQENNNLLKQIADVEIPAGLGIRALAKVSRYARKQRIMRQISISAFIPAAFLAVWSFRLLFSELQTSALIPVLKLAVSDKEQVLSFFGDWIMAVAEALPLGAIILSLSALFVIAFLADLVVRFGSRQKIRGGIAV